MKTRILFVFVGLFTIAPSVLGSIPQERRDMAAFIGGKSECEAKVKSVEQASDTDQAQVAKVKAKGRKI